MAPDIHILRLRFYGVGDNVYHAAPPQPDTLEPMSMMVKQKSGLANSMRDSILARSRSKWLERAEPRQMRR